MDGARGGWLAAWQEDDVRLALYRTLDDLIVELGPELIAIDMPIGLPIIHVNGGRACEIEARKVLGPRRNSIFTTAPRDVVAMDDATYDTVAETMRTRHGAGLSRQSFALLPRIREVDSTVRKWGQARIIEVHPELSFLHMNDGAPLLAAKKSAQGEKLRRSLLARAFGPIPTGRVRGAATDDCLDALAALCTGQRVRHAHPARLPEGHAPVDGQGLRMEMWA